MKLFNQNGFAHRRPKAPPPAPGRHMLPHERRAMLHIELDDSDWDLMRQMFGDEDTAEAAMEIICGAPPEIQIIAVQLIDLIKEAARDER